MATVHTPVDGFAGTVVGVEFVDGAAEVTDEALLGYFARHGYRIDEADEPRKHGRKKADG